jgi:hypothetical protein
VRPKDQRGATIGALERCALVAGRFMKMLFVRLEFVERHRRREFGLVDRDVGQRRRSSVRATPMRGDRVLIDDLDYLEIVVIIRFLIVVVTIPAAA